MTRNKLPDEVQAALEHLLRTATRDDIQIAGFAVCPKGPTFVNFGTDAEFMGDIKYYELACKIVTQKVKQGNIIHMPVGEVS